MTDTFGLKDDSEEIKASKIQQIFKNRGKKHNVPDIKVTPTYTNKFLSKISGKSSSVDNLSSDTSLHTQRRLNIFSDASLKTKSLSTNEIFLPESPAVSRSGSVCRINRKALHALTINDSTKPASYHGSFENLERKIEKIELTVPGTNNSLEENNSEEQSCNCPFVNSCTTSIKGWWLIWKKLFLYFMRLIIISILHVANFMAFFTTGKRTNSAIFCNNWKIKINQLLNKIWQSWNIFIFETIWNRFIFITTSKRVSIIKWLSSGGR